MPQKPHDYNQEAYKKLPNEPGKSANAGQVPLTPTQKLRKDNLMRQFCKRAGRLPGHSQTYAETWERVFGQQDGPDNFIKAVNDEFRRQIEEWEKNYQRNYELIDWGH